jgi:hypothetical protein
LLVARPEEQGTNQIVGNAVNYCAAASPHTPFWLKKTIPVRDSFETENCPITFEGDILALQWITRKSLIQRYVPITEITDRQWRNLQISGRHPGIPRG